MLQGLTLQQLAAKIEANSKAKRDFVYNTTDLEMVVDAEYTEVPPAERKNGNGHSVALVVADQGRYPILKTAHEQIGARLDIPRKYYDRCLDKAPDLLATNVNRWFRDNPERRMIRTLAGRDRAFLSDRFNRIEHEEIAKAALPVLADIPDVQIISSEITERRMYLQAVTPRLQGDVKVGDTVQAGVLISNSEIGFGAVLVTPLIYRLVCKNGMVVPDGRLRASHIGRRVEDNEELWADDTRQADDRAILLKVRDTVRACVDEAQFRTRVAKLSGLTEGKVTGDPTKVVGLLAAKVGANEEETGGILRSLIEGGDLSAWGLLNAVTAQAHSATSYDRAVEFEQAGGALVELSRDEWRGILNAA